LKVLAIILAGGTGKDLSVLTRHRAKTAVPFGGRYRIIDFCLSNCVHSGISEILLIAQYKPKSLLEHIRLGKPWDLDRKSGGISILQPTYYGKIAQWYKGTSDALFRNREAIRESNADLILVLSGDQVYLMNYKKMAAYHRDMGAPATIAVKSVSPSQRSRFGMVRCAKNGIVTSFLEKPTSSEYNFASMGIYLFDRDFLLDILSSDKIDIVFDIVIPMSKRKEVAGFKFDGYWEDIGSIPSYFNATRRLLKDRSLVTDPKWPIFTRGTDLPGAKFSEISSVKDAIVGDGCDIRGKVVRSIVFPGVYIEQGAIVEDSIIFPFSRIGRDARIRKSIIDKHVSVGSGVSIGVTDAPKMGYRLSGRIEEKSKTAGIALIGKKSVIPKGIDIPAGFVIEVETRVKRC